MNKNSVWLTCILGAFLFVNLDIYIISYLLIFTLILIYIFNQVRLINLIILLEMIVLNLFFLYFFYTKLIEHEHWNIFFILVFSAAEASLGLALLVYLRRGWGEILKIGKFNWLCRLIKP